MNFRTRNPAYYATSNHYYSFNVGYVHFITVDFDYYDSLSIENALNMFKWIENDLIAVTSQKTRQYPFVVVISHRPIYCSYNSLEDETIKRCYNFYGERQQWDSLWFKYGVDLMISGHIHSYER